MRHSKKYIALDLGGTARCLVGAFDGETLTLHEIARFENPYTRVLDQVYWDVLALFAEVQRCLHRLAAGPDAAAIASLGVDTMGIAFGLLDTGGALLANPRYSRLPQEPAILAQAYERMPPAQIYAQTGLPPHKLNSLYGLLALRQDSPETFAAAATFLMLPDLINYWLTGRVAVEYTIASTSHLLDARTRDWAFPLLNAMDLPLSLFPELVEPGQVWANLHPAIVAATGLPAIPVIATASHDTAAAVAAVPAAQPHWAYLSSGTWGMIGAEVDVPILTAQAREGGFANEGGAGDTIRFIHNNLNLWLLQACRKEWAAREQVDGWAQIVELADQSEPFMAFVDPNDAGFFLPESMPAAIQAYCRQSGQPVPQSPGQIARVILESLACQYRHALDKLSALLGHRPDVLHIVGGGGRNRLLNQFAANATGLPVVVGPFEATAAGNIIIQMIVLGDLSGLAEGRELIRRSFALETYVPLQTALWDEHYTRFTATLREALR